MRWLRKSLKGKEFWLLAFFLGLRYNDCMMNKEMNMTLTELLTAGIPFRAMTDDEYDMYPGAENNTLIAESEVAVYFLTGNRLDILTEESQTSFDLIETFVMGV